MHPKAPVSTPTFYIQLVTTKSCEVHDLDAWYTLLSIHFTMILKINIEGKKRIDKFCISIKKGIFGFVKKY